MLENVLFYYSSLINKFSCIAKIKWRRVSYVIFFSLIISFSFSYLCVNVHMYINHRAISVRNLLLSYHVTLILIKNFCQVRNVRLFYTYSICVCACSVYFNFFNFKLSKNWSFSTFLFTCMISFSSINQYFNPAMLLVCISIFMWINRINMRYKSICIEL